MAITDLPMLSMLRTRMQWHQERQRVLAENVANADTPGFRPRDLTPIETDRVVSPPGVVVLARTDPAHFGASGASGGGAQFASAQGRTYDARPTGNAVNLEDEMIKVAANQMDHQAVTSLYSRSLGLFKTALGKR
jgi:flagellar basal-body rod protein FlgB